MATYSLDPMHGASEPLAPVRLAPDPRTIALAKRVRTSRLRIRILGGVLALLAAVALVMAVATSGGA